VLAAHSPSEAVSGCVVGALTAVAFIWWAWDAKPGQLRVAPVALSLLVLTTALHDIRVPTQRWITHIALHLSGHERPFIRARWKAGHTSPRPTAIEQSTQPAARSPSDT
jgi:hypothetical protein